MGRAAGRGKADPVKDTDSPEALTVIVADHRPVMAEALGLLAQALPSVARVDRARRAPDLLAALLEERYASALFCLDGFREMDGFSLCGEIQRLRVDTGVVVLLDGPSSHAIKSALGAGANAVVPMVCEPRELDRALVDAARGRQYLPHELALNILDGTEARSQALGLTQRQRDVLALAASGSSNGEIAGELFISPSTVKRDLSEAFKALGVRDRLTACQKARELGIVTAGRTEG
ncbi:MAG: hypothetical protein GF320_07225 [Armatimonadia bacterium]|nr:hypothetical protein [Armatimonadia bacterium]